MSHTTDATTAHNGDNFGAEQAARLLATTTQETRRRLAPTPPWLLVARGVLFLAVCVTVWLNVRGQHPYRYPTAAVVPALVGFGVLNTIVTLTVAKRRTTGVSGKSRLTALEIGVLSVACIAPYVAMVVSAANGVRYSIVYGWLPLCGPLLAGGLTWAVVTARRGQWGGCATGLGAALVGALGVATGAAGEWLTVGIGVCLLLVTKAVAIVRQRRTGDLRA